MLCVMPRSATPSPGIGRPLADMREVVDDVSLRLLKLETAALAIPRGILLLEAIHGELKAIRRLLAEKAPTLPVQPGSPAGPLHGGRLVTVSARPAVGAV